MKSFRDRGAIPHQSLSDSTSSCQQNSLAASCLERLCQALRIRCRIDEVQPFDIPLRALIASEVDGLMMAGRYISGDFLAQASYRVTGNAVAMGEAAGVTATLAGKSNQ